MTGWLFVRDYWPQLQPGQPPPFRIDLADEAQNNIPVRWSIFKDGKDHGYARTWVNFRSRDDDPHQRIFKAGEWEFELGGEFKLWTDNKKNRYGRFHSDSSLALAERLSNKSERCVHRIDGGCGTNVEQEPRTITK